MNHPQQPTRDFIRHLTGRTPDQTAQLRDRDEERAAALEAEQKATEAHRRAFIRRLTNKTITTDQENQR